MTFFIHFFTILSSITITWFQTHIDVPVGGELDDYLHQPYAVLEVDGVMIDTPVYYQTNGVNYTFQSTINTHIVRDYTLYFEAYFEDYDMRSKQAITISIYDDIPPNVTAVPQFVMHVGDDPPDFMIGFMYEDNYDETKDITVKVIDDYVSYDVCGIYDIIYQLTDTSFQTNEITTTIEIIDVIPPVIEQTKSIEIERYDFRSLSSFFKVTDNYDVGIPLYIDDNAVDYGVVGIYPLYVVAADQFHNETTLTTTVHIIDTTPPTIRLVSNPPPITVGDIQALSHLYDYILSIDDQGDVLNIEEASIIHDIQIDVIGLYEIDVSIKDQYGNEASKSLQVSVVDDIVPLITLIKPLEVDVFSNPIFLTDYFMITDNYDDLNQLDIDIDEDINYDVIGTYPFTLTVEDQSKNITIYQDYIAIIDDIAPSIEQLQAIMITDFVHHPLYSYFSVSDNYDEDDVISLSYDETNVDYETIGIYPLIVYASDQSLNITTLETEVIIMDITNPTLELIDDQITISVNEKSIDFNALILTVGDNYSELNKDDVIINNDVNLSKTGVYWVTYDLFDDAQNRTTKALTCIVDDFTPPVLSCEPITIAQYDIYHLFTGISAYDDESSCNIYAFPQSIDTSQPGNKYVTYVAQDERGNYTSATQKITVLPVGKSYEITDFIPVIVILFSGGIIILAIKKHV